MREKLLNVLPLRMMFPLLLCGRGGVYIPFVRLRKLYSSPSLINFIINGVKFYEIMFSPNV